MISHPSNYTQPLEQCHDIALAGGKAVNLGKLIPAGFTVPGGFVITTQAYLSYSQTPSPGTPGEGQGEGPNRNSQFANPKFPTLLPEYRARVLDEICAAYREMGGGLVAVRSSATAEDLASASMAGQYETILNVEGEENMLKAVQQCWASVDSPRTRAYLAEHGIDRSGVAMAVIVQRLVPADVAGVLFTVDPNDLAGHRMLLEASWGLGESVVSGRVQPDILQLDGETGRVLAATIADKKTHLPAGVEQEQKVEQSRRRLPCLSGQNVYHLWQLGKQVAAHFGSPQDIEWAIAGGELYLLQSRPITTGHDGQAYERMLRSTRERLGRETSAGRGPWVLHNLAETLPHPTPLTWSVIQRFMSGGGGFGAMYRQAGFEPSPAMERDGFLELIAGRIYMDASRAPEMFFAGFPFAYDVEKLKDDPQASQAPPTIPVGSSAARRKAARQLRGVEMKLRDLSEHFDRTLRQEIFPEIEAYVSRSRPIDLTTVSVDWLIGLWQQHEKLVLETFAPQTLLPSLISAMALADLTQFLRENFWDDDADELALFLSAGAAPNRTLIGDAELHEVGQGQRSLESWLAAHGHRAAGEFDLASPRWSECPQAARDMAQRLAQAQPPLDRHQRAMDSVHQRVAELAARLSRADRAEFQQRIELVQRYIPFREDGKDFFMLGYGLLRQVAMEAGRRLAIGNDVFYLTRDDLFDALRVGFAPLGLIEQRKAEHHARQRLSPPRVIDSPAIEKLGEVAHLQATDGGHKALVLSQGRASGPARIVRCPTEARELGNGYILVCPSTDPSWTPLFASAAGLVMECGGALSHGAVVAREMGLPAVLVPDATRLFKEGESIDLDARGGWVASITNDGSGARSVEQSRPTRQLLPPPPGRKERRAAKLRNICAAIWAPFLLAFFAMPLRWVHDPTIALLDRLLWPLVRELGRAMTVALVAAMIAIATLLVQKLVTDNSRLLEAKRRAAKLNRPSESAAVQFRTFMASLVPVGILLGPMVLPFVWFQQRMDPSAYTTPAGSAVQIVAMVDGGWSQPVTIEVPPFVALDVATPASRTLPPLRQTLERLLALYRQPRNDPSEPWELQTAPDLGRQQTADDLQAYLDAGIPPQGVMWQVHPPADFAGRFAVAVSAPGQVPVTIDVDLGDRLPPGLPLAMGPAGSPVKQVRVAYPRPKQEQVFLRPLRVGSRSIQIGWVSLYVIVYLPVLLVARRLLRIA